MVGLYPASAQTDNLRDRFVTGNSGVSMTPPSYGTNPALLGHSIEGVERVIGPRSSV